MFELEVQTFRNQRFDHIFDYIYQGLPLSAMPVGTEGELRPEGVIYEWTVGGRVLRTESSSYTPGQQDVGQAVSVRALLKDAAGNNTIVLDPGVSYLVHDVNDGTTGGLVIRPDAGGRSAGTVLTLEGAIGDPDGMGPLSYQWLLDDQPIAGATGDSYVLTEADLGRRIVLAVDYIDGLGVHNSYRTDGWRAPNVRGTLVLDGVDAPGQVLQATLVDPDGPRDVHYAWERADAQGDWHLVDGAGGPSLVLDGALAGPVRVLADYADDRGTVETLVRTIGTDGDDVLHVSYPNEQLEAGAGNDTIYHAVGSHRVDAGAGLDTYIVDNGFFYSIKHSTSQPGTWYVHENIMRGTVELSGVERVYLGSGRHFALDIDGAAGQAYRLYRAAFDREPDAAGVGFWIDRLDKGVGLIDVATAFVASAEFATVYGANPDHAGLVAGLYQHVLHRAPDAASQFWVDVLDRHQASVAEVLAGFSESAENVAALAGVLDYGVAYQPWA